MFLWHCPSGFPAPPLAGILPGGARTFLPPDPKNRTGTATARPTCLHRWYSASRLDPTLIATHAGLKAGDYEVPAR